ncbi:organoarsenical effux MFS transporter ArsJ [Granulosicoccaceae sp. 1_MG-2023]|nr:organoarsenical effux MFS transporter ArsJ [Granulosicoccaceae sp. 1_MG-2023]
MNTALRNYLVVTGGYWGFTLTDGAIRMLVVLYFHQLGYSAFAIASLFLFYEFFGVVTNLVGGWLGARLGLNRIMHAGMLLQVGALLMLTVPQDWLGVAYVMCAQALSGIAKDLNKMSAKASVKHFSPDSDSGLFRWVAVLTGSKNALKGAGFFLGAVLLEVAGFRGALFWLAGGLFAVFLLTVSLLPAGVGQLAGKPKFTDVFSKNPAINRLSAARFFLFGARDVWFVVGLPVFLADQLGWSFSGTGAFMAVWVIGYGIVQATVPGWMKHHHAAPRGASALFWVLLLTLIPAAIALGLQAGWPAEAVVVGGLLLFGAVFAVNSAVHSYLILAYADHDKVALNVGFYYMANAGGRLIGTVASGLAYQTGGLVACLWISAFFLLAATLISRRLP